MHYMTYSDLIMISSEGKYVNADPTLYAVRKFSNPAYPAYVTAARCIAEFSIRAISTNSHHDSSYDADSLIPALEAVAVQVRS